MAGGRCARTARFCLLPGPPSLRSLLHLLGGESATRKARWDGARLQGQGSGPVGDLHRPGVVSLVAEEVTVETLNRLRAMVGLPKYLPPMPRPPTGDRGWMA